MSLSGNMIGGCCICLDERGWKENPLVYCDGTGCDVAVHQNCYGITKVPSGPWFCQKCADTSDSEEPPACCLCPRKTGALKKTTDKRWAHVVCAIYLPDITFGDTSSMEPVILDSLPESYFHEVCYICEEKGSGEKGYGACISCHKPSCKSAFHVTCGQERRLIGEEKDASSSDHSQFCGYCDVHIKLSSFRQNSNSSSNSVAHNQNENSQDKFQTPLTVDVNNEAPKGSSRSKQRQRPAAGSNPTKPKRPRKAPAKKNAGNSPRLVLHSPGLKSPLRSPLRSLRSPGLLSPTVRSAINLAPITSAQQLLEQQFDLGKKMLENQAPLDISQLLSCITKVQQENKLLEEELQSLTARRDTLVSLNARLALPTSMQTSLPTATSSTTPLPPASSVLSGTSLPKEASQRASDPQPISLAQTPQKLPSAVSNQSSQNQVKKQASVKEEKMADVKSDSSVVKISKKDPHQVKASKSSQSSSQPQRQTPDSQHFPWPPNAMFQLPASRTTTNAVGQMLPPINALGQSLPSVTSTFAAQSVNARGAAASSYNPYTNLNMFSMSAAMGDLNSMALPSMDSMQQLAGLNSFMSSHPMQRPPNE